MDARLSDSSPASWQALFNIAYIKAPFRTRAYRGERYDGGLHVPSSIVADSPTRKHWFGGDVLGVCDWLPHAVQGQVMNELRGKERGVAAAHCPTSYSQKCRCGPPSLAWARHPQAARRILSVAVARRRGTAPTTAARGHAQSRFCIWPTAQVFPLPHHHRPHARRRTPLRKRSLGRWAVGESRAEAGLEAEGRHA